MQSEKTLAGLSRYVVKSPEWYYFLIPIIAIFGIDYIIIRSLIPLIFIGIIPFIIFVLIDFITIRMTNKKFNRNRIVYLDFISLGMATIFFWIVSLFAPYFHLDINSILAISIAFPVFLRFLVLYIYYPSDKYTSFILSLNYTYAYVITSIAGIFIAHYLIVFLLPVLISSVIYLIFAYLFIYFTMEGFTRKYHSNPSELIDFFLNRSNDGEIGENFFRKVYNKKMRIPVMTLNIKDTDKNIATLVFPFVHPGPFGNLCTSNLPYKLSMELNSKNIMVFHTATTNSNNCSGINDIKNIADAVKTSLNKIEYSDKISDFIKFNVDGYDISLQKFGNSGFSAVIPYKKPFDDISMSSGLKVVEAMEKNGAKNFALLDAQNSFVKGAPELDDCTFIINPLIEKFKETESEYPAMAGYASHYEKIDGLAVMGIQVLALKIKDKYNVIVLTDSNNINREIIKAVRSSIPECIKKLDIYTTDNHVVNVGQLDINPLGMNDDQDKIVSLIIKTVEDAVKNVTSVVAGMDTQYVNVTMGEENAFHSLINTVISSIKRAKYSVAFVILISIMLSILTSHYVLIHI